MTTHIRDFLSNKLILTIVWGAALSTGFWILWNYELKPEEQRAAPSRWPNRSELEPASDRPTLVLFAHPRCPCTRASLEELSKIHDRMGQRARFYVLFFVPKGASADWYETDLWKKAALTDILVRADVEGFEASRFGAVTSGQVVLYDAQGQLRFQGGITGSRGHVGDNRGKQIVTDLLTRNDSSAKMHCVYGCRLIPKSNKEQ